MDLALVIAGLPLPPLPRWVLDLPHMERIDLAVYGPGHPWYYRFHGPLVPAAIHARKDSCLDYRIRDVKTRKLQLKRALERLPAAEIELVADITRYNQLRAAGCYPYKRYSMSNYLHGCDMEWCQALSLKHNHISYHKAEIRDLRQLIENLS